MIYEIITAFSFICGGILIFLTNREKIYLLQGILLFFISLIFIFSMKDSIPYKNNKGAKIIHKTYLHYLKNGFTSIFKSKALNTIVIGLTISGIAFALWSNLILFPLYSDYGKSDSNIAILRSIVFIFSSLLMGFAGSVS
ncbi:MAG: hypothetical protein KAT05_08920, partial [Spirochaetes bacterium]|nr:hypothetical protein [Spirochaetota bacterium]